MNEGATIFTEQGYILSFSLKTLSAGQPDSEYQQIKASKLLHPKRPS